MRFPAVAKPAVSVVIVVYGAWDLLRRTLEALNEHTEPVYEVVAVDNASPDDTLARLDEATDGIRIAANEDNVGFARGANQGARLATGEFLCFLNSDAVVQSGWLRPLLAALHDPEVAAAVPLLLNPDGTVQEAGSVVDSDGWATALGADEDPDESPHCFRREIQFGSAACMVVRRDAFEAVEGFSETYGFGYYEDVDLCFRLRERGFRVMLEPASRVEHVRFGSSDQDRASRLVVANRRSFVRQWYERLAEQPALREVFARPRRVVAGRDIDALDRFLVIDDRVPHVDQGSGDPRMADLLVELARLWPRARVTLLAADDRNRRRYAPPLQEAGVEVAAPGESFARWFDERRLHYSVVLVSRPQNIERFDHLISRTQPHAQRVFDIEALSSRRLLRMARLAEGTEREHLLRQAAHARATEHAAARGADATLCVTDEEAAVIRVVAPGTPVFVLPSVVRPLEHVATFDDRDGLVFYGGFLAGKGSPNEDAALHFIRDVLPLIRRKLHDVEVRILGASPTAAVREAAAQARVEVLGYVDDPLEHLNRARVHVNPLRYGAGIKLKLLDSMAAGLPFVTTSVGAEGLRLGPLYGELVAEDAIAHAELAVALYSDRALWERAHDHVLDLATGPFGIAAFRQTLIEAMVTLGVAPPTPAHIFGSAVARSGEPAPGP